MAWLVMVVVAVLAQCGGIWATTTPPPTFRRIEAIETNISLSSNEFINRWTSVLVDETPRGEKVLGSMLGVCLFVNDTTAQCQGTVSLARGDLQFAGAYTWDENSVWSIMGGTQHWLGVFGTMTNELLTETALDGSPQYRHVFRLQFIPEPCNACAAI